MLRGEFYGALEIAARCGDRLLLSCNFAECEMTRLEFLLEHILQLNSHPFVKWAKKYERKRNETIILNRGLTLSLDCSCKNLVKLFRMFPKILKKPNVLF